MAQSEPSQPAPDENATTPVPRRRHRTEVPPMRTVEETIALHRGEWILMKVKGFDEDGWPERGLVLAHSPRRGRISQVLAKEPPRTERPPDAPYEPYYLFRAFPRYKTWPIPDETAVAADQ